MQSCMIGSHNPLNSFSLPPLPAASNLCELFADSDRPVAGLEQPSLRIHSSNNEVMFPPIVCLKGSVTSAVIPRIQRFLETLRSVSHGKPLCLIVDLQAVDVIETCVADFMRGQAMILTRLSPTWSLVIVVSEENRVITSDLGRGNLKLKWPPVTVLDDSCVLAFQSLEIAIRTHRYESLVGSDVATVSFESLEELSRVMTYPQIPTIYERLHLLYDLHAAGLKVRKLSRGEVVSCVRYPFRSNFIVLAGQVIVRKVRHDNPNRLPQGTVRQATIKASKALVSQLLRRRAQVLEEDSLIRAYQTGDKFESSAETLCCAHAASEVCWILDIDPGNIAGQEALKTIENGRMMKKI